MTDLHSLDEIDVHPVDDAAKAAAARALATAWRRSDSDDPQLLRDLLDMTGLTDQRRPTTP